MINFLFFYSLLFTAKIFKFLIILMQRYKNKNKI